MSRRNLRFIPNWDDFQVEELINLNSARQSTGVNCLAAVLSGQISSAGTPLDCERACPIAIKQTEPTIGSVCDLKRTNFWRGLSAFFLRVYKSLLNSRLRPTESYSAQPVSPGGSRSKRTLAMAAVILPSVLSSSGPVIFERSKSSLVKQLRGIGKVNHSFFG